MKVFFGSIKKKVKGERLPGYLNKFGLSINNNLVFYATSNNHLLIDGKYLKPLNQNYHRKIAHLSSKRLGQNKLTKRMINLINKINNQMTCFINKAARLIIDFSLENKVSKIIIGYNDGFKDINL